ncbi:MAG: hypothetical protein IKG96_08875 [Bacteroidaceae bacterium]|nr:hypothetical protein [Bacteroidaceae bacterium]
MERQTILALCLACTTAMRAQQNVAIAPQLNKGDVHTYTTSYEAYKSGTDGDNGMTGREETTFTVTEATPEGYVLEVKTKPLDKPNIEPGIMGNNSMDEWFQNLQRNQTVRYRLDRDGAILGILNAAEMQANTEKLFDELINRLNSLMPSAKRHEMREMTKRILMEQATEESVLKNLRTIVGPLTLLGRRITSGMEERYAMSTGLKFVRTFTVAPDGRHVTTDSRLDMTDDELKEYVIDNVLRYMPNIPAEALEEFRKMDMKAQGIGDLQMSSHATVDLGDDGWPLRITLESENNLPGNHTISRNVMERK